MNPAAGGRGVLVGGPSLGYVVKQDLTPRFLNEPFFGAALPAAAPQFIGLLMRLTTMLVGSLASPNH